MLFQFHILQVFQRTADACKCCSDCHTNGICRSSAEAEEKSETGSARTAAARTYNTVRVS